MSPLRELENNYQSLCNRKKLSPNTKKLMETTLDILYFLEENIFRESTKYLTQELDTPFIIKNANLEPLYFNKKEIAYIKELSRRLIQTKIKFTPIEPPLKTKSPFFREVKFHSPRNQYQCELHINYSKL